MSIATAPQQPKARKTCDTRLAAFHRATVEFLDGIRPPDDKAHERGPEAP